LLACHLLLLQATGIQAGAVALHQLHQCSNEILF
jgi:hypothetical protein